MSAVREHETFIRVRRPALTIFDIVLAINLSGSFVNLHLIFLCHCYPQEALHTRQTCTVKRSRGHRSGSTARLPEAE